MVLIKTEVPINELPQDYLARNDIGLQPEQMSNNAYQDYQLQLRELERQNGLEAVGDGPESALIATSQFLHQQAIQQQTPHNRSHQAWKTRSGIGMRNLPQDLQSVHSDRLVSPPQQVVPCDGNQALALADYQMQLMLLEQHRGRKKRVMTAPAQQVEPINNQALADYQRKLMFLDCRKKARTQRVEPSTDNKTLQEYQRELLLLEQQGKTRIQMARASQTVSQGDRILQDYQMQLQLLEQQEGQRRALEARTQQAEIVGNHALEDYNRQLFLLQCRQYKERAAAARAQPNATLAAYLPSNKPVPIEPQPHIKNEGEQVPDYPEQVWGWQHTTAADYSNSYTATEYSQNTQPQVIYPWQALPGTPGTVCSPPIITRESTQNPTLVIRGGPPPAN